MFVGGPFAKRQKDNKRNSLTNITPEPNERLKAKTVMERQVPGVGSEGEEAMPPMP